MRIFVKYNRDGEILSVSKIAVMPESLNQPYTLLGEGEAVLEVPAEEDYLRLDALKLHEGYEVDIGQEKLVKKSKSVKRSKPGRATAGDSAAGT